ncbi:McrC family protein [Melioribacter sp. OK-6-Me]|uniref:McrC family protein n=1 Tax=unclassified Melioribacter TaxID=2627329 RepID=UPI003ED9B0F8
MSRKIITVFEHGILKFDKSDYPLYEALVRYFEDKATPYYSLIHNGVKFNQYVGVLQIGNYLIEVLPKADRVSNGDIKNRDEIYKWRRVLISMLRTVNNIKVDYTGYSNLRIHRNTILDLYFELFIHELEYLIKTGLVKSYRRIEKNLTTFKGRLVFNNHIIKNYIHRERFFVNYSFYDYENLFNIILYKALNLISKINTNLNLQDRINSLLFNFPELPNIKITQSTFDKLVFNRKTHCYKNAINIAKQILLQYHPDLRTGRHSVLALMFDMNELWEKFIFYTLRKYKDEQTKIESQKSMRFLTLNNTHMNIRADIIVNNNNMQFVLDTKWKVLQDFTPSSEDLYQIFVYQEYYNAQISALIYPYGASNESQKEDKLRRGFFRKSIRYNSDDRKCFLIKIPVIIEADKNISFWQKEIYKNLWSILTAP